MDADTITHHLIAGVAYGSIHPAAFTIWLQLSKSPSAIALALTQQNASSSSAAVRRAGIKQLGKSLASSSSSSSSSLWKETWDGLGGAEGVARVVGECLSVQEVAEFARTVGRCGGGEEERRREVAALVVALGGLDGCARARGGPPSSSSSDGDGGGGGDGDGGGGDDHRRPLSRALAPLAQACPAAFVEDALARGLSTTTTTTSVDDDGGADDDAGTAAVILSQLTANGPGDGGGRGIITQRHPAAVQAALHRALFDIDPDNDNSRRRRRDLDAAIRPALLALLHGANIPSTSHASDDEAAPPNFSPSMHFSLRVLRSLAHAIAQQRPHAFPPELFVSDLVEPLLRRCRRRRHSASVAQVREILTVRELYDHNIFEAKHLLVGNPGDLQNEATTIEALRNRVVEANDVLWTLVETIVMAMREPAAGEGTAKSTRNLCHDVIRLRWQKFSVALKKTGRFSEDDIYAIVWEDTLALLVKAEKAFLQPGPDRFASEDRKGVLGYSSTVDVENAGPSTYRFFDEFAKARDEIWRDFRSRSLPATALLPEPYPRGLAIQELTSSFRMRASAPEDLTPYIASRAHAVLFMDPANALAPYPDDEDMQTAIEGFADCYLEALEIFVPKSLDQQEKKRRVDKAWAHAVGPLSRDRMSLPEAFRYWRGGTLSERFEFWPKEDANPPQEVDLPKHDPRIPRVANPSEILEWDPLPPAMAPVKERRLDLVYIDIAKSIHIPYLGSVKMLSEDHHPTVPGVPADQLYTTLGKDTAVEFESRAMSALLFLDTKNGTDRMILESPFPSAEEVRYPAMRLDSKFLQKGKKDIHWAFRILKSHSLTLPPLLLFRLAQDSLEEIQRAHAGSTIPYEQEKITFGLIALLHESDRPALAVDLGINAITNFPDASSWHRQLLTPTLLRRLSPADASACITRFADAITTSLQAAKQQQDPSDNPSPPPPRVKITTVKHLAQLLQGATYIPPVFATEILTRILQAASHPDIRHAVLDALLSMLTPSTSTSTSTSTNNNARVLAALETLIVDAGSKFSPDDGLPAKLDLDRGVPPLLSALLHYINSTTTSTKTTAPATTTTTTTVNIVPQLVRRVVLPALAQLQSSTRAWAQRFASTTDDAVLLSDDLPVPPLDPRVWGAVFTTIPRALIPKHVAVDAVRWMRHSCIDPPASGPIRKASDAIRTRAAPRDRTEDEKRWLALFAAGPGAAIAPGGDDNAPVDVTLAQDLVLQLSDALTTSASPAVWAEEASRSWRDWHALVALLEPPAWMCAEDADADMEALGRAWRANARPLVVRLVEGVEAWRRRAHGTRTRPATLPDVFGVGLWLLPWPGVGVVEVGVGEAEEGWRRFADAVAEVLGRVVGEEVVYHRRFERVKKEVAERVKGREDRVRVALGLGWVGGGGPFGVVERLRIELALELLGGFDVEADGELTARVEEMVVRWKKADDEDVRRAAYEWVERLGKGGLMRGFAAV
ncbi:hypothetical protein SLS55_003915 [Diplodia seriata]|uniref:Uncharacterized protein n=1 Tax=Diplodia seriata TaxID=420778 RepID=A0ABR3CHX6_9PEZI